MSNLRLATPGQNKGNIKKPKHWQGRACSSKFKGVHWNKRSKQWRATVSHGAQTRYLGQFNTEEEAARAYNATAVELFGEFAALNDV